MEERSRRARLEFLPATPPSAEPGPRHRFTLIRTGQLAPDPPSWPTSGDPNIIGEHEVPPVRCACCKAVIPWAIIKGWRD